MTDIERTETVHELVQNDVKLRGEVSTARTMNRVSALFEEAIQSSGLTQAEIAEIMEVSTGRISQILGEPGNFRISTITRLLNAVGFEPQIWAKSLSGGKSIDGVRRKRSPRTRKDEASDQDTLTVLFEEYQSPEIPNSIVKRIIIQDSPTSRSTQPAEWQKAGTVPRPGSKKSIQSWIAGESK